MSEVVIPAAAGIVTSIIITGSVERMSLKGDKVCVITKATSVSVEKSIAVRFGVNSSSCVCDSSPNRHVTKHFRATENPIVRSLRRAEDWVRATS